jgi:hypothetical protein
MKKGQLIVLGAWMAWMALTWCNNSSPKIQQNVLDTLSHKTIGPENTKIKNELTMFNNDQKILIEQTLRDYFSFFQINWNQVPLVVIDENQKLFDSKREVKWNEVITGVACTEDSAIFLNTATVWNNNKLKNAIIHEAFHTLKAKHPKMIQGYTIQEGLFVKWFQWMSMMVEKDNKIGSFNLMEDAAAEACAARFNSHYEVQSVHYANLWSLMLKIINQWWLTLNDLTQAQMTNWFDIVVAKIFNKSSPSSADIQDIVDWFSKVYNSNIDANTDGSIQKIIETIQKRRG